MLDNVCSKFFTLTQSEKILLLSAFVVCFIVGLYVGYRYKTEPVQQTTIESTTVSPTTQQLVPTQTLEPTPEKEVSDISPEIPFPTFDKKRPLDCADGYVLVCEAGNCDCLKGTN